RAWRVAFAADAITVLALVTKAIAAAFDGEPGMSRSQLTPSPELASKAIRLPARPSARRTVPEIKLSRSSPAGFRRAQWRLAGPRACVDPARVGLAEPAPPSAGNAAPQLIALAESATSVMCVGCERVEQWSTRCARTIDRRPITTFCTRD